ncbi:MAG: hypothetical protein ACHQX3_10145, partial [Nitrospirales bacterium]
MKLGAIALEVAEGIDMIVINAGWKLAAGPYRTFADHPNVGDSVYLWADIYNQGDTAVPVGTICDCGMLFAEENGATWHDTYAAGIAPGETVRLVANDGEFDDHLVMPAGDVDVEFFVNSGPTGTGRFTEATRANNHYFDLITTGVTSGSTATESFNQVAEWPIGPDQTWEEGHQGTGDTTQINSDGSDALQRVFHVVSNKLTIAAPDDSELTGGDTFWTGVQGMLRSTTNLDVPNMRVSATITGQGPADPQYILIARSAPHVSEDLPALITHGYIAFFENGVMSLSVCWVDGGLQGPFTGVSESYGTLSPGDELSLTVTGTGLSTLAVMEVNGVTVAE